MDELVCGGKPHGREWLKGRHDTGEASTSMDKDPYFSDVTAMVRRELEAEWQAKMERQEAEFHAKMNRQIQDNIAMVMKKIGEANPGLNLDVGDFCATLSSEEDENGTPFTAGTTS